MLQTTQEQIEELTGKVNKILEYYEPKEEDSEESILRLELSEIKTKVNSLLSYKAELYDETFIKQVIENFDKKVKGIEELLNKSYTRTEPSYEEPIEDKEFTKKRWIAVSIAIGVSGIITVLSLKYAVSAFTHSMGLFTVCLGFLVWLFADKYFLKGDTIGKLGSTSIGVGLASIAIMGFYGIGVFVGTSYLSNPFGSDNERSQQVIERAIDTTRQQQPAPARSNGVVLPTRAGDSQGEQ